MQYNSLIYSEGFPSRAKNPKLKMTFTVISPPNEWPRLTTKLQHFIRQFYIYFYLLGHCPRSPTNGGLPKVVATPPTANILQVAFPPHYKLGSNAVIPLNTEDNQAPQTTISHLEADYSNSTTASFAGK